MIRIFRKNRQEASLRRNIANYLLYAIGEILLVVIGILLALYINNRNEEHKNEQKIRAILAEVLLDLENDIQAANELIRYYEQKDSLIEHVFTDTLTYEDYRSAEGFRYLNIITNYNDFRIHDNGFINLMRNSDIIPAKFEPFMDELKQVYINDKRRLDLNMGIMEEFILGTIERYARDFPWFSTFFLGKVTDEAIHYHMHDPFYKNQLIRYTIIAKGNLLPVLANFRQYAIAAYVSISREIKPNPELPDFIGKTPVAVAAQALKNYIGEYEYSAQPDAIATISVAGDQLYIQLSGQPKVEIFASSDTSFTNESLGVKIVFNRNTQHKVRSFTLFQFGQEIEFVKKD